MAKLSEYGIPGCGILAPYRLLGETDESYQERAIAKVNDQKRYEKLTEIARRKQHCILKDTQYKKEFTSGIIVDIIIL